MQPGTGLKAKDDTEVTTVCKKLPVVGLTNIGNTCFMNSILQCMFVSDALTRFFAEEFTKERGQRLAPAYHALVSKAMMTKPGSAVYPSELKIAISKKAP